MADKIEEMKTMVMIHNQTIGRILKFIEDWDAQNGEMPTTEVIITYLKGLKI